jgi:hypothetical protein
MAKTDFELVYDFEFRLCLELRISNLEFPASCEQDAGDGQTVNIPSLLINYLEMTRIEGPSD